MDLILKNNSTFSLGSTISANITGHCTTAFIRNCPNVLGINVLRQCVNLTRVRIDIGNATGTLKEICAYAQLNGFDDNGNEQTKPRIVGTFTITDFFTLELIEEFESKIDGLNVEVDSNAINITDAFNNGDIAIQTMDSLKPNYNPAVAIILDSKGIGCKIRDGEWFLHKTEALNVTSLSGFSSKTDVYDTNKIVSDDPTLSYEFKSFNELKYFGVTTAVSFYNCSKLSSIEFPENSTIGNLRGTALKNLYLPDGSSVSISNLGSSNDGHAGNDTGVLNAYNMTAGGTGSVLYFKKIYVRNNANSNSSYNFIWSGGNANKILRIKNGYAIQNYQAASLIASNKVTFLELNGLVTGTNKAGGVLEYRSSNVYNGLICHYGYNGIAVTPNKAHAEYTKVAKIYVGDGSSKSADMAVFNMYNSDADWSAYCGNGVPGDGKIDLWYNYNGIYKTYTVTDILTDCVNTNPSVWPYIERCESYQTSIIPNEGYEMDSVTVEMLDTDSSSQTFDTMIDITNDVYDSSTGNINIPSVTGNIVITANANLIV